MGTFLWISIGLAALWLLADAWTKRAVRRGAQRAVDDHEALYSGTHQYVGVDAAAYPRLDLRFYDALRDFLRAEGFEYAGDVENLTLTGQMPHMRTFIRAMSGDRGAVIAGFYHVVVRGWQAPFQWIGLIPRRLQVLDLETELSDGTWVVTTNTLNVDTTPLQENLRVLRMPLRTSYPEVLQAHRDRLRDVLAETGLEPRRATGLNEILAAVDRLQQLRNEALGSRDGLVATIESTPGSESAKKLMIDEVRRA